LNPKKAKEFIPQVADSVKQSEELVEAIVRFYWQEVRKALSSLKHNRVHITNLGDFIVKHWKMEEKIQRLELWEESNKQKGLQQMTARFKTAENLFDLKNLKNLMKEEEQRKDFIKLHKRKKNEPKAKHNKTLENKRTNSRGRN
jgi:nucleoid DNA-binding protein